MNYCKDIDKRAIVSLVKNNKKFEIVINNNLPIYLECKNNNYSDCTQVRVDYQYDVKNGINQPNGDYLGSPKRYKDIVFAPILGIRANSNYSQIQIYCRGIFGSCSTPGWYTAESIGGSTLTYLNPSISSITPSTPQSNNQGKGVIIKDKNGTIVYDDNLIDCNWQVTCGDCPEGYMRCNKSEYPGYCCISCSEIKSGIASATAVLRSINNG